MSELGRRLVHASGGIPAAAYAAGVLPWRWLQYLLTVSVAVVAVLEFLRLTVGLDWAIYDRLTREYEADNVAGYALYVVSMAAVAWVFPPPIAVAAMLMLAVGDPISGALSRRTAAETKRPSTLAAMFGVCFVLAVPLLVRTATTPVAALSAAAGALGATVADGVKPVVAGYVVDDNLTSPPAAALAMSAVLTAV